MEPQDQKEKPKRAFIGGEEVGGPVEIVQTPSGKYLKRGGQYRKIESDSRGAKSIEGFGEVKRVGGKIVGIGDKKVEGELEL